MIHIEDNITRYLRTAVPVLWGSVASFLLQYVATDLSEPIANALYSEQASIAVTAIVIFVWYWVWGKVNHLVPDWLSKLVLGSEKEPTYK